MDILALLKDIDAFKDVPDAELQWLINEGEIREFEENSYVFKAGDPIDNLLVILKGHTVVKAQQGNQYRVVGHFDKHTITGNLPYSRADKATGQAQATQATTILTLPKSKFREMIVSQENLTTALVHSMSTRIREFTKNQQLNDKMMSLGKLSAGLAHELNNPSAAIVRSSQTLGSHLKIVPENFKNLIKIKMTDEQVDVVSSLLFSKIKSGQLFLSMMDKSEKEDELVDWLDDHEIDGADEIAENLVLFGFKPEDMEIIANQVSEVDRPGVINWMNQNLITERLLGEIEDASQRINKLVSSVKSYTHMDQAPEKVATDIHKGLENTLTMLNHKINKSKIKINREFQDALPQPAILPSEMNQVWTNIIDNALDAMKDTEVRELTLKTVKDGDFINVIIGDTGSGIPLEIQDKIFDPFFTTKAIGEGTGLGMEVVHRIINKQHNGSVTFESKPGKTEFKICFPINQD